VTFLLLHAQTFDPAPYVAALAAERVEVRRVSMPGELASGETPTALVLDAGSRDRFPASALRQFVNRGGACLVLGGPDEADLPDRVPEEVVTAFLPAEPGHRQFLIALRSAFREGAGVAGEDNRRLRGGHRDPRIAAQAAPACR